MTELKGVVFADVYSYVVYVNFAESSAQNLNNDLLSAKEARALSKEREGPSLQRLRLFPPLLRPCIGDVASRFIFELVAVQERATMWRQAVLLVFCLASCALANRALIENNCVIGEIPEGIRCILFY